MYCKVLLIPCVCFLNKIQNIPKYISYKVTILPCGSFMRRLLKKKSGKCLEWC